MRASALMTVSLSAVLAMTACSAEVSNGAAADDGTLNVVASTDVWGDIAKQVGGHAVTVTSLISSPDQDPHSFEASASTALAISQAELVIENGGGYDDFVGQLLEVHDAHATVLNAVEISGHAAAAGELNEHVWYDLTSAAKVADAIASSLSAIDPDNAETFEENAQAFDAKVQALVDQESRLKDTVAGQGIGITEPVPLYMTEALGLVDKTPDAFSEAIEEGDEVSPAVLKETLDLYTDGQVAALVYNEQTTGPLTDQVKSAAEQGGIPVVPVTETLPEGLDYVAWMQQNLDELAHALD
jgi:zinc/manganese transport system substrate-binding protein